MGGIHDYPQEGGQGMVVLGALGRQRLYETRQDALFLRGPGAKSQAEEPGPEATRASARRAPEAAI